MVTMRGFRESHGYDEACTTSSRVPIKVLPDLVCRGSYGLLPDYEPTYCRSGSYDKIMERLISLEIERCDKIIERLISSERSNFLVRNNGELVDIKSLQGKVVGLVFMSLPPPPEKKGLLRNCILDIASAYNELSKSKKGKFEIVLIAQGECESVFNDYLKMMPWLAVPFIDSATRNLLYSDLAKDIEPIKGCDITLFDCHGKLLRLEASNLFSIHGYGADGYPFTDRRLKEIRDEDDATRANMSLKNLLGNSTRDFVLENNGTEVPISRLEDMVVGIYFYDVDPGYWRTLVEVYEELKQKGKSFEVVMVSAGGSRSEDYLEQVKKLPWLALPIDSNGRRLMRLFNSPFSPRYELDKKLVIIGAGASFVNESGSYILDVYGIDAYPFSRLSVAEMVKARLEEVSLRSLLTCGDQNDLISWSGEEVPISDILGKKTIVLFFSRDGWWSKAGFEQKLIKWYEDMKLTDGKFEVILVEEYGDKSSFNKDFCEMPWLALPYKDSRIDSLSSAMGMGGGVLPTLAVFAPSGQLVTVQPKYCFDGKGGIRLYSQNLLRDVYLVLADSHSWPPFDPCGEGEAEFSPFGEGEEEAEF